MSVPSGNSKLSQARRAKNDEFYTQIEDIESELYHYRNHFRDKTVLLNCDDPQWSNFWQYFALNFETFNLKRLVATHYTGLDSSNPPPSYKLELTNAQASPVRTDLAGAGDFRSPECIELLKQADIVVTNPPFSLFREFVTTMLEYNKKFMILGNPNAITYKEVWPHIKAGTIWLGVTANGGERWFKVPSSYDFSRNTKVDKEGNRFIGVGVRWYTNLDHSRRHEEIPLFRNYDPNAYPKYDNYDAIEVGKVANIPADYFGAMGVPITFLGKHNPDQFEILGCTESEGKGFSAGLWDQDSKIAQPLVRGKKLYKRIFIRRIA